MKRGKFIKHVVQSSIATFAAINTSGADRTINKIAAQQKMNGISPTNDGNNYGPADRESIEWCDIWLSHADETNLPRVLLLGDSITRAYYPEVEKLLAGTTYVNRLTSSAFITDPMYLVQIKMILNAMTFDLIHFNNGMHGWKHSEKEYGQGFPELLSTIKNCAPKAKLIWANTTSLKNGDNDDEPNNSNAADNGKLMLKKDLNKVSEARIVERNKIAKEIMQLQFIPINDLYSLTKGRPELHSGNVHFNSEGIKLQAKQVSEKIKAYL